MELLIVIIVILLVVIGVIVALGKAIGAPDPKAMSVAQIEYRLKTEFSWIKRYLRLPIENQQYESLRKKYRDKEKYLRELVLEYNARIQSVSGQQKSPSNNPSPRAP